MDLYEAIMLRYYKYFNEISLDEFPQSLHKPVYCATNYYQYNGIDASYKSKEICLKHNLKPKNCIHSTDVTQYLNNNKIIVTKEYFHKLINLFVVTSFPCINKYNVHTFVNKIRNIVLSILEYDYNLSLCDYLEFEFFNFDEDQVDIQVTDDDIPLIQNEIYKNRKKYNILDKLSWIVKNLNDSETNILYILNKKIDYNNTLTKTKLKNIFTLNMIDPNLSHLIMLLDNTEDDTRSCKMIISYFASKNITITEFLFAHILADKYRGRNKYDKLHHFAITADLFNDDFDVDSDGEPILSGKNSSDDDSSDSDESDEAED